MNDKLRQLIVFITILGTIVINILANALPINGLNTGQISDQFDVYFVPAGYVFSIWGLIYIGLIGYAIYQALPAQRQNPRLRATGWWVALGGLANSIWIFLWHYEQFLFTVPVMLILLGSLIVTFLQLAANKSSISNTEKWLVHIPFSVYLGWITVATVANITDLLEYLKWDGFGISPVVWMWIMLAAVLVIASLMNFSRRDVPYALVILWSLAGISIKHASISAVSIPTWVAFGGVALTLILSLTVDKSRTG